MIETLNQIDTDIFLFFNGMRSDFLDRFMMMFTGRFIWVPMYASILFIFTKTMKPKMIILYTLAIALAITLTDQTCATFIRPFVERLRPSNLNNALSEFTYVVNDYRGGPYGFPSCHSANSFALATFMTLLVARRKFTWFIFGWAILNSYSRLYIGVHYPGDLLVGAIIGSAYGALCYHLAHRFDSVKRSDMAGLTSNRALTLPIGIQFTPAIRLHALHISNAGVMMSIGFITTLIIIAAAF